MNLKLNMMFVSSYRTHVFRSLTGSVNTYIGNAEEDAAAGGGAIRIGFRLMISIHFRTWMLNTQPLTIYGILDSIPRNSDLDSYFSHDRQNQRGFSYLSNPFATPIFIVPMLPIENEPAARRGGQRRHPC